MQKIYVDDFLRNLLLILACKKLLELKNSQLFFLLPINKETKDFSQKRVFLSEIVLNNSLNNVKISS